MLTTDPVLLNTDRLILRELNPEFYNHVMTTYSDSDLKLFFGIQTQDELESEKLRFKQGMTMSGKSFLYFHLLERQTNRVLGWCGYHTWFTQHRRAEIGYVLNDDKDKGKGYMREAIIPVIRFGFEKMNLHRIEALIAPGNTPSIKLIQRAGFTKEGILREHYMKDSKLEDSVIFSLLRHEFS